MRILKISQAIKPDPKTGNIPLIDQPKPAQNIPTQLNQDEAKILNQVRSNLLNLAPELGDIMQSPKSKATLFAILNAVSDINMGQLKTILQKIQKGVDKVQEDKLDKMNLDQQDSQQ